MAFRGVQADIGVLPSQLHQHTLPPRPTPPGTPVPPGASRLRDASVGAGVN